LRFGSDQEQGGGFGGLSLVWQVVSGRPGFAARRQKNSERSPRKLVVARLRARAAYAA